jgi:hypothetical protein
VSVAFEMYSGIPPSSGPADISYPNIYIDGKTSSCGCYEKNAHKCEFTCRVEPGTHRFGIAIVSGSGARWDHKDIGKIEIDSSGDNLVIVVLTRSGARNTLDPFVSSYVNGSLRTGKDVLPRLKPRLSAVRFE